MHLNLDIWDDMTYICLSIQYKMKRCACCHTFSYLHNQAGSFLFYYYLEDYQTMVFLSVFFQIKEIIRAIKI